MIDVTMGGGVDAVVVDEVRSYQLALRQALDGLALSAVHEVAAEILAAYDRGGRIFVFGNGGSAATASHMVCDLGKNTAAPGLPRLNAYSLTDNTALIMALANDLGYSAVFSEQLLQAQVQPADLAIAISASGNSPNVLAGVATARAYGARTVGITGFQGGELAPAVDVALVVASTCMEIVEDIHLVVNHAITSAVRAVLRERALAECLAFKAPFSADLHGSAVALAMGAEVRADGLA